MADSRYVGVNGLRLHYLDFGNKAAPPLLCLHGLTGNAHQFDQIAPVLSKTHHVMSFDCRGRGESEWGPRSGYNQPQYAKDLLGILDVLGIDRATLVGTSMGGLTAMNFAATHPSRVERLVINDIGPEVEKAGLLRILKYAGQGPKEFKNLGEVASYYREIYSPIADKPQETVETWAKCAVKSTAQGRLAWKMDPAVRLALVDPAYVQTPAEMWAIYRRISAPILLVRGEDSDVLSSDVARRMQEAHRTTRFVNVPGVGHAPWLDEPEVLEAMRGFFSA